MGVRASQAYVSAVGKQQQDGELRVRRMYVDVLIQTTGATTHNEAVSQNLSLTDNAEQIRIFSQSADNTLNLNQSITKTFGLEKVDSTLNLVSTAVGVRDISASVSNALSMSSTGGRTRTANETHTLYVSQFVTEFNYVDDRKPAGSVISLSQSVELGDNKFVEHTLGLTQTVDVQYPIRETVLTPLVIAQHTSTPHRMFVEHVMSLQHLGAVPLPTQHITHTLNLSQSSPIGGVTSTLNITHTATYGFSHTVSQDIGITDKVDVEGLWVRSVSHSDILGHSLTWYEDTPCGRKQYTPFQGENTITSNFSAPDNELKDPQGDTGNFSLYVPYLGTPTSKVILRSPELDNRDRNAYTRINRETRGGKLVVYADPIWPKVRTLAVTIIGLLESEIDEFQDFVQTNLGKEIGLTDWEGRLWKGYIKNPNEVAVQDGKKRWTLTFEFEGEMLDDVQQPDYNDGDGQAMTITQSVTAVIV